MSVDLVSSNIAETFINSRNLLVNIFCEGVLVCIFASVTKTSDRKNVKRERDYLGDQGFRGLSPQ